MELRVGHYPTIKVSLSCRLTPKKIYYKKCSENPLTHAQIWLIKSLST